MNIDWELVVAIVAALIAIGALYVAWLTKAAAERSANIAQSALEVARESAKAADVSAQAANRSAEADELSTSLAQGLARTCHMRWEVTKQRLAYREDPETGWLHGEDYGLATLTNKGEEVALNVHAVGGDAFGHEPVSKLQPGESCEFMYDAVLPDADKTVVVEWDRPAEFGDERMRVQLRF